MPPTPQNVPSPQVEAEEQSEEQAEVLFEDEEGFLSESVTGSASEASSTVNSWLSSPQVMEVAVRGYVKKLRAGNVRILTDYFDRITGKPTQRLEVRAQVNVAQALSTFTREQIIELASGRTIQALPQQTTSQPVVTVTQPKVTQEQNNEQGQEAGQVGEQDVDAQ